MFASPSESGSQWSFERRPLWLMVTLMVIATRLPSLVMPIFNSDESGHLVHAQRLLAGEWPYLGFVDNKPPLLYAIYALFAAVTQGSLIGVHLLTMLWVIATALVVARAARHIDGADPRLAALLYAGLSPSYFIWDGLATHVELLASLFLALGSWAFVARRPGLAGAAGAAAALTSQLAGVFLVATLVSQLWGRRWRGAVALAVGAAAVAGGVAALLAAGGVLDEAFEWCVRRNFGYIHEGEERAAALVRLGKYGGLFAAVHAVAIVAALRAIVRARAAAARDVAARLLRRWLAPWLAAALLACAAGGRFYGHYFLLLEVPLALAASTAAAWTANRTAAGGAPARRSGPGRLARLGLVLPVAAMAALHYGEVATGTVSFADPLYGDIAGAIRHATPPGAPIFVWGYGSPLYYLADRPPATRFVYPQSIAGYRPGSDLNRDPTFDSLRFARPDDLLLLLADLERRPPALIVDLASLGESAPGCDLEICAYGKFAIDRYPQLAALIARDYRRTSLALVAAGAPARIDLYLRR